MVVVAVPAAVAKAVAVAEVKAVLAAGDRAAALVVAAGADVGDVTVISGSARLPIRSRP